MKGLIIRITSVVVGAIVTGLFLGSVAWLAINL